MSMICPDPLRRWFHLPSIPTVAFSFVAARFLPQTFLAKATIPRTRISCAAQIELAENGIMPIPRRNAVMAVSVVPATSIDNAQVRTLGSLGFRVWKVHRRWEILAWLSQI
jgi:hypothetical protein